MSELITVKVSDYPSGLVIAKSYLEDHNILCFIKDELISQIYPFFSNAAGGAKLQVLEDDAERAIALLVGGGFVGESD